MCCTASGGREIHDNSSRSCASSDADDGAGHRLSRVMSRCPGALGDASAVRCRAGARSPLVRLPAHVRVNAERGGGLPLLGPVLRHCRRPPRPSGSRPTARRGRRPRPPAHLPGRRSPLRAGRRPRPGARHLDALRRWSWTASRSGRRRRAFPPPASAPRRTTTDPHVADPAGTPAPGGRSATTRSAPTRSTPSPDGSPAAPDDELAATSCCCSATRCTPTRPRRRPSDCPPPARHQRRPPGARSRTSRSTPGSTTRRGATRGALAAVDRAERDDLRRPRRARRLEHLALLARRMSRPRGGGADRRRADVVLGLPAPRQPRPRPSWTPTPCTRLCCGRPDEDGEPMLRDFAAAGGPRGHGAKGYRWSYRRDVGARRVLVVDSRCGRMLDDGRRTMVDEQEFAWIVRAGPRRLRPPAHRRRRCRGCCPGRARRRGLGRGALRAGRAGRAGARFGERLRRAADLEHWAAFGDSFERLAD